MTYSEKLKDPRWFAFREAFIERRRGEQWPGQCDDCGEDTRGPLHVHHRRYISRREPWEYEDEDLRLLCATCHEFIHNTEQDFRAFVLTLAPHECFEVNSFLSEVDNAQKRGLAKIAFAHAKNAVRNLPMLQNED